MAEDRLVAKTFADLCDSECPNKCQRPDNKGDHDPERCCLRRGRIPKDCPTALEFRRRLEEKNPGCKIEFCSHSDCRPQVLVNGRPFVGAPYYWVGTPEEVAEYPSGKPFTCRAYGRGLDYLWAKIVLCLGLET